MTVPSTSSQIQIQTLYEDFQSLASIKEFIFIKEHLSLCLGYFLEQSKKNENSNLNKKSMILPLLSMNIQIRQNLPNIDEDFNLIRTDIRSMCYLENKKKIIIELNGENLQILLFSINDKIISRKHQTIETKLGVKTISEKIWMYLRKFCYERGIQDDNEVKTKAHVDNLVFSYFVLEHFEQSEYKNIRIKDAVTGKSHHYKVYLNTIKRLYKQYIQQVETKIKKELRLILFKDIMELINFKTRLTRPIEEITFSDMSVNLSKNQNGRSQIQQMKDVPMQKESIQRHSKRMSFSGKTDLKFQEKFSRDKTPAKQKAYSKKMNSLKKESNVFNNKSELLNSKYLKSIKHKFSSTLKIGSSFQNGSFNKIEGSIRDTSITRNKSQLNKSRTRKKSQLKSQNKRPNFKAHKKRATFTHFPLQSSIASTKDNTINHGVLNRSKKRTSLVPKFKKGSIIGNVSNIFKETHLVKSNINDILHENDADRPDVVGKFRQRYVKTMTNFKDDEDIEEQDNQFLPNDEDLMVIQDLQEFLEFFNGKK